MRLYTRNGLLVGLLLACGASQVCMLATKKSAVPDQDEKLTLDFKAFFEQEIANTRTRVEVLRDMINNVPAYVKKSSYATASGVRFLDEDPTVAPPTNPLMPAKMLGVTIDFDDAGLGPIAAFTGCTVDVRLDAVPEFLRGLFEDSIKVLLQPAVNGILLVNQQTKRRMLKSSPFVEFVFKVTLLVHDLTRKADDPDKITALFFNTQVLLLLFKLSETPGYKEIADVFKKLPPAFEKLLQVKIDNKAVRTRIEAAWDKLAYVKDYDFSTPDRSELTSKDLPQIIKIMAAIALRARIDFYNAKYAKKSLDTVKNDTTAYARALISRFKTYRVFRARLLKRISPFANAILNPCGMNIEMFFPPEESVLSPEDQVMIADAEANVEAIDAMFQDDILF